MPLGDNGCLYFLLSNVAFFVVCFETWSLCFLGLARSIETSELYSLSPISIGSGQIRLGQIRDNDVGAERELSTVGGFLILIPKHWLVEYKNKINFTSWTQNMDMSWHVVNCLIRAWFLHVFTRCFDGKEDGSYEKDLRM